MCAKWNDKFDPSVLAERLEACCSRNSKGEPSFSGGDYHSAESVLKSAVAFSPSIRESERQGIVWKAISTSGRSCPITAKTLLAELSKAERELLAKPNARFVVLTNLSVKFDANLRRRLSQRCSIQISRHPDPRFDQSEIRASAQHLVATEVPTGYSTVILRVNGRSPNDAALSGIEDLDLLRGIWNLCLNRAVGFRFSYGKVRSFNHILAGPLYTIHEPTGKLATQGYFYEQSRYGSVFPVGGEKLTTALRFEKKVRLLLSKSLYREEIEEVIRNYCRALDETNYNAAFLRLWAVLERVTATPNASYDVTVRRAAAIFEDWPLKRQVLEHLRRCRNQQVHAGSQSEEPEMLLCLLKQFVEGLITFHLGQFRRFCSLDDAGKFLDLPRDRAELTKQSKLLKLALNFRK